MIFNRLLLLVMISLRHRSVVLGLPPSYPAYKYAGKTRVLVLHSHKVHLNRPSSKDPPTIKNPITKRSIHLGGPTYQDFLKQGSWIQHEGTLKQLDLKALNDYQQGVVTEATIGNVDATKENGIEDENRDEWHFVTPSVVNPSSPSNSDHPLISTLRKQLLFVHKPSGLHCVPSRDLSIPSLSVQVSSMYPGAKPCHRLDRDTSGIVVFGLTDDAHREISKQFEARTTSKTYMALISGCPSGEETSGIIDLPIGKKKTEEGFHRWTIGGLKPRDATTKWSVDKVITDAQSGAKYTRVELKPLTGRGHQLRLHMKAIGCPILGDTIHGEGGVANCSPRLCLHAHKLQVDWNGLRVEAKSVTPF